MIQPPQERLSGQAVGVLWAQGPFLGLEAKGRSWCLICTGPFFFVHVPLSFKKATTRDFVKLVLCMRLREV